MTIKLSQLKIAQLQSKNKRTLVAVQSCTDFSLKSQMVAANDFILSFFAFCCCLYCLSFLVQFHDFNTL